MKNVHVIPTDKPSKIGQSIFDESLHFNPIFNYKLEKERVIPQNIYITSNEEIKEGDWIIWNNKVVKAIDTAYYSAKKIILTTDQDLIKDGVQAIDDTFLEWFVKNPSCEWVEVEEFTVKVDLLEYKTSYKIIITKEEPKLVNNCFKCGLDLVIKETSVPVCTDIDCRGIILSNETLREWALQRERQKQHLIDIMKGDEELGLYDEEPKQEPTLEEAGVIAAGLCQHLEAKEQAMFIAGFIECAKWQAERMYSEEDMVNFALFLEIHLPMKPRKTHRQLLEQYKKK